MKKLIGILVILVVIGAIGLFALSSFAGKLIKTGVVTLGPEVAQVEIELDKAHISFLSGSGGLEKLKVHNPEGFKGDHAFYADHLSMKVQPMSVLSDKIVVDEILIIGPDIQFEGTLGSSNLSKILENVQSFMGPADESADPDSAAGKKLEIKRFVLQDAKVGVGLGTKPVSLSIPTIELTGLGADEEGITAGEVVKVLMTEVTGQILAAITKNPEIILQGGGELIKGVGDSGSGALKSLGGLFGGGKKDEEDEEDEN